MKIATRKNPQGSPAFSAVLCAACLLCTTSAAAQDLLVSSFNGDEILRYDGETGEFIEVFASGGGLDGPLGMVCHPDGHLYVSGFHSNRVHRYSGMTGEFINRLSNAGNLNEGEGMTFGPDNLLYVAGFENDAVLRYDPVTGDFIDVFASGGGLDGPAGVAFGPDGNFYVASFRTHRILRFDGQSGEFIDEFASGGGMSGPEGITFGPDGNLYVGGFPNDQVFRYDGDTGAFMDVFASGGGLDGPVGMVFGPDGHLYVAGWNSSQVHRFDGDTGAFIDVFASGGGLNTAAYPAFCSLDGLPINPGVNDAWFDPLTNGQGFFIIVFPDIKLMFLAWFTYDTERPDASVTANLGDPGHRWITAQGPYEGNTGNLQVVITRGGIFDASPPAPENEFDGTMEVIFETCTKGVIKYRIESLNIEGEVPIQRITLSNVALCAELVGP